MAAVQLEEDSVSDRNQSTSCLGNKQSSEKNHDLELEGDQCLLEDQDECIFKAQKKKEN